MAGGPFAALAMPGVAAALDDGAVVILPVGATEAHGRHLPLGTDTLLAEALAARAAERAGALVAPPLPYGVCSSTRLHPGTVDITLPTLQAIVTDLLDAFRRHGARAVLILSGHAGKAHVQALRDAATRFATRAPEMRLAVADLVELLGAVARDLIETPGDSHAGEVETSLLLHLAPDLVRGTSPAERPGFPPFLVLPDPREAWPGAVWGDPGAASAEKGAALAARAVEALDALCRALAPARD